MTDRLALRLTVPIVAISLLLLVVAGVATWSAYRLQKTESDILVHDIHLEDPSVAFMLARMEQPNFPQPVGVFRPRVRLPDAAGRRAQQRQVRGSGVRFGVAQLQGREQTK